MKDILERLEHMLPEGLDFLERIVNMDSPSFDKEDVDRIQAVVEPLLSIASGGENTGLATNSGRAVRLAADALRSLAILQFGPAAAASARSLTSGATLLNMLA